MTIKITQQKSVGDVHVVVLELPSGDLVKVTVIGTEAKAEVLDSNGNKRSQS